MNIKRKYKLIRKFLKILFLGARPSCLKGRLYGPRVILNSVPKCGTNLLQEIIHRFPAVHGSISGTMLNRLSEDAVRKRVSSISKGECVPAHLFYSRSLEELMIRDQIKMILIIRDFRDAILSHINYIDKIDVDHRHHNVFREIKTFDDKIDACLNGVKGVFKAWPALASGFRGWMTSRAAMVVRYEDLIGDSDSARVEILKMAKYIGVGPVDADTIMHSMFDAGGLTFNSPGCEKWKKIFNEEQINKINKAMKDNLEFFGYSL